MVDVLYQGTIAVLTDKTRESAGRIAVVALSLAPSL
jgi:hypothetical protein